MSATRGAQRDGRILVAYDGTPSARRALHRAAAMHREGDDVGVIHVNEDGQDREGHLEEARQLLAARNRSRAHRRRGKPRACDLPDGRARRLRHHRAGAACDAVVVA
jgi:nucleotide-binding universal stress UspA family protein